VSALLFLDKTSFALANAIAGKKLTKKEEEFASTIKNHGGTVTTTISKAVRTACVFCGFEGVSMRMRVLRIITHTTVRLYRRCKSTSKT